MNPGKLYRIFTDHLGSLTEIVGPSAGDTIKQSFDAWGRRRNPVNWTYNNVSATFLFNRGFTGHEHLDQFVLINMNGRVYDPLLGRFLSPDNFVQLPDFTQSFNRYTYCLNNPLRYTDPSGYTWLSHFTGWVGDNWKTVVTVAAFVAVAFLQPEVAIYWAGSYAINLVGNNMINNKMSLKEAFRQTPMVIGMTWTIPYNENKSSSNNYETSGSGISEADLDNMSNTGNDYVIGTGGKYLGESVPNYGGIKGLTINTFYGYSANGIGGVVISLSYTSTTEAQGGNWVQMISTDFPSEGKISPYFDSKDGSIYYPYKTVEGNSISFYDNPQRPLYNAGGRSNNKVWLAILSLYKGNKSVFGIFYGFNMYNGITTPYPIEVIYP